MPHETAQVYVEKQSRVEHSFTAQPIYGVAVEYEVGPQMATKKKQKKKKGTNGEDKWPWKKVGSNAVVHSLYSLSRAEANPNPPPARELPWSLVFVHVSDPSIYSTAHSHLLIRRTNGC